MLKRPNPRLKPDTPIEYAKLKIVVVGDCKCGKTQFAKNYCNKIFQEEYESTIGSDFFVQSGKYGRGTLEKMVQLSFWDLSGDQSYVEDRSEFYKDAQALIIMCDITNQKSFDNMEMWMREVGKHGGDNVGALPVFIVGNKMDLKGKR